MAAWFIPLIAAALQNSDNKTASSAGQILNSIGNFKKDPTK